MAEEIAFAVKRITWSQYEHETPILLQEANGPCPLIALVNTLLLQNDILQREADFNPKSKSVGGAARHTESIGKIRALLHRHLDQNVPLNEVLACLGDVLLDVYDDLSVVNRLLENLPLLHTGLSVNPNVYRGGFPRDLSSEIFDAFGLHFVHGWIWDPVVDPRKEYFERLQTFDDIQDFLLHPDEDPAVKADIQQWLDNHSTQLTAHGLKRLDEKIAPDSLAVFFRNNHFMTIYKAHDHDFYLLVTDLSLLGKCVWQLMVLVSGSEDLFFAGNFVPILENSDLGLFNDHEDLNLVRQLQEEEDAAMAQRMQKKYEKRTPALPKEKTEKKEKHAKNDNLDVPKKSKLLCVVV